MIFPPYLLLIRHAESRANAVMRALDQDPNNAKLIAELNAKSEDDWEITEQGCLQALQARSFYRQVLSFGTNKLQIFSSSKLRARQTSEALFRTGSGNHFIAEDPRLRERSWGELNLSWRQFREQKPEAYALFNNDPYGYRFPTRGAESLKEVIEDRITEFIVRAGKTYGENNIVVAVTHADYMLGCRVVAENISPSEFNSRFQRDLHYPRNLEGILYQTNPSRPERPFRMKFLRPSTGIVPLHDAEWIPLL
jgi:broad specificity phosphatase PhoE